MKKGLIFTALLLLIIGVPLAKKKWAGGTEAQVTVGTVEARNIKASILASGRIKHQTEVKLSAEVIGKVSSIFVEEGDQVSKGQLLLTIDDRSFKAAVEQQQAAVDIAEVAIDKQKLVVENARTQWLRKQQLYQRGLLDKEQHEQFANQFELAKVELRAAVERLKQARAQLKQAQQQLQRTRVKAPIAGKITSLDIKVGETAISSSTNIAGSSLLTIADPASMLAEVNVDEADIAQVKLEQEAEVVAVAFEQQPIAGTVSFIANTAKKAPGQQNLSFAVRIRLDDKSHIRLRPGMSCRAEIVVSNQDRVATVPLQAIRTEEDNDNKTTRSYVFVLDGGKVHKRFIETGISDDEFAVINQGLNIGDRIVTGPDLMLRTLQDNQEVEIISSMEDESER